MRCINLLFAATCRFGVFTGRQRSATNAATGSGPADPVYSLPTAQTFLRSYTPTAIELRPCGMWMLGWSGVGCVDYSDLRFLVF